MAVTPDGGTVISGSSDSTVRLWNISTGLWLRDWVLVGQVDHHARESRFGGIVHLQGMSQGGAMGRGGGGGERASGDGKLGEGSLVGGTVRNGSAAYGQRNLRCVTFTNRTVCWIACMSTIA